ncbi:asparagine synthase (glutamine-hydrolyzing) [Dactylosporangium matsuzakiense]|uniref:asparagine synthase (glutamine-hydrolyzing) n=1 Tax=Dactylosporangium matsuzakiense TaxID=53360 RepID=A0A9W6KU64_9ACTN|nr:putative asparagine synthetase [glutamine-hydrolyzing] [Dactylosporangium matsuzakiense]
MFLSGDGTADPSALAAALDRLRHRGPDETSLVVCSQATQTSTLETWSAPGGFGVVFGFTRLAIIDVAHSHQPVQYAERWTVVFNGELYNFRELRTALQREHGASFATEGEAEVLAAAYHYWGPAAVRRLRGMFAAVLWDEHTGTLHAIRDPFGIKPLYHLRTPDGLYLASEKKALLPFAGGARRIGTAALSHYLTLQYVPEPATLHPAVHRLPAGHALTCRPGEEPVLQRYFQIALRPAPRPAAEAIAAIRDALRDSVHAHLQSEVPLGAFLSSGVDSSAVVALAREKHPNLRAYTAGFDDARYSEIEAAAQTAAALGVHLTATVVRDEDVIEALPRIVWHLDDPVADPAIVPLYFLCRTAARDVTVVLSGEGADELFGGYEIYREPAALARVAGLPDPVRRGLRAVAEVMPEGVRGKSFLQRATTPIGQRYYGNARIFGPAEKAVLMRGPADPHTTVTSPLYAAAAGLDDISAMQYVDLHTWLPGDILTKADRMSMAHSLELRVPFLDRAVWAAAAGLPPELKISPHATKHALREAVRDLLPPAVVDRRKLGFPTPTRVWLRGPIGEWAAETMATADVDHLIDVAHVQRLLAAHRKGGPDHSRKIWTVLMFCLWYAQQPAAAMLPVTAVHTRL